MRKNYLKNLLAVTMLAFGTVAGASAQSIHFGQEQGLPGSNESGQTVWESGLIAASNLTSDATTIEGVRITVFGTSGTGNFHNDFPMVALGELEFYDADGNKIEYTGADVTTNSLESSEGSLDALCDNDYESFYHSTWNQGTEAEDYIYLDILFPRAVDSFTMKVVGRNTYNPFSPTNIGVTNYNEYCSRPLLTSGYCGENITWSYNNGTITISGSGYMYDTYRFRDHIDVPDYVTNVVIEEGVENIANHAFDRLKNLKSVTLPSGMYQVGYFAFAYSGLESIDLPNSIVIIGENAFRDCSSLASVTLPDQYYEIKSHTFTGCSSLKSIELPGAISYIGSYAFDYSGLESIVIHGGVTELGENAFSNCTSLESATIGRNINTIKAGTFNYCTSLKSITIDRPGYSGVVEAHENAFSNVNADACTVYVCYDLASYYSLATGWDVFTNFVEGEPATFNLTVSAAKYATLYLDYAVKIPAGARVYYAKEIDGETLMMERITDVIPAETGVIVTGAPRTYTFEQSGNDYITPSITDNLFKGSSYNETITPEKDYYYYVLAMVDGVVGMYRDELTDGVFTNNANKAYLPIFKGSLGIFDTTVNSPSAQLGNRFIFDFGGVTGIESISSVTNDNVVYDLKGIRVENPSKGIYISNGKKVVY